MQTLLPVQMEDVSVDHADDERRRSNKGVNVVCHEVFFTTGKTTEKETGVDIMGLYIQWD